MIYGTSSDGVVRRTAAGVELLDLEYPDLGAALSARVTRAQLDRCPVRETRPEGEVQLLAPVAGPRNVWAAGLAYRTHVSEAKSAKDGAPSRNPPIFLKAASSITGPDAPIELPAIAPDEVDYEGEVAVVVGTEARSIRPQDAWHHVLGVTAANDVSARDVQFGRYFGGQLDATKGKSFDTFTPLGPWVATPDEYQDRDAISLTTWVNGERRQAATTAELLWPISEMLAFLSRFATLSPGDLLLTGTPGGVGRPRGLFLRAGDTVRVKVAHVGTLANPVVDPRPSTQHQGGALDGDASGSVDPVKSGRPGS